MGDGGQDYPPPPPAQPAGWQTGPPDFIGVGVQRCGTTRWFDLIASHPEIANLNRAKELHYFDRFYLEAPSQEELDGYHQYFPRDRGHITGEWTPFYLSAPWVPPLLARTAPNARLLVLLRDPVDRLLSGIQLARRQASRRGERLSRYTPLDGYVRGLYHAQLTELLRHFQRSQVMILQYERCTSDPLGELRRTFEFIGVEDAGFLADTGHHPQQQSEKPVADEPTRAAYVEAYSADVLRLRDEFPEVDLTRWPNFVHLA